MYINDLIRLANLLDQNEEWDAAKQIDELIRSASEMDTLSDDQEKKNQAVSQLEDALIKIRHDIRYLDLPSDLVYVRGELDELADQALLAIDSYLSEKTAADKALIPLLKLANYLDVIGQTSTAEHFDTLIAKYAADEGVVVSPDTLDDMKTSVDRINSDLESAIEVLRNQNDPESHEKVSAASLETAFERLSCVADKLDAAGAIKQANAIDQFIKKYADSAYDVVDWKEPADNERSKRYDSKHHHNLQVREPKRDQERVDREGRKEHHVSTYQSTGVNHLSSRYCPDHIGVQMGRVGEATYQCPLDNKVYNFTVGFKDHDGNEHPGGSVAAQTPDSSQYGIPHRIFDTRSTA